ncbi:HNH endonuclease [Halostagnicola sp. A56]
MSSSVTTSNRENRLEESNLRTLCADCHSEKTVDEN